MYRIEFTKSAAKSLKKIPKNDQKRIKEKIDSFTSNLPDDNFTKMKGNNPFHKVRVGSYRIIFEKNNDILVILIIKIGHRKDVYKNLSKLI